MQARPGHALVALLAAVVAGVGPAGCGGGGDDATADRALREGRYAGETSQGLPISFVVTGTTVSDLTFGWRAKCDDGQVHANTIALPGGGIRDSAFSSGGPLETGGIAHVQGRFDGERFAGELSRSQGSAFGTNCRATGIAWSAELASEAPPAAPEAPTDDVTS